MIIYLLIGVSIAYFDNKSFAFSNVYSGFLLYLMWIGSIILWPIFLLVKFLKS